MTRTVWLHDYECMTMTVMTENKLETNQQEQQQQQVDKWYLEPPFAVKNVLFLVGNYTLAVTFSQSAIFDPKTAHFLSQKNVFWKRPWSKNVWPTFFWNQHTFLMLKPLSECLGWFVLELILKLTHTVLVPGTWDISRFKRVSGLLDHPV
jgi:hypothetical protein